MNGYVCVTMNSTYDGKVKVSFSEQDPTLNQQDSESVLVYRQFYDANLNSLKNKVYELLVDFHLPGQDGYFQAEPYKVIDIIQSIETSFLSEDNKALTQSEQTTANRQTQIPIKGYELFNQACDYYYGRGSVAQDYSKAYKLFEESSGLGVIASYIYLGRIYEYGDGVEPDVKKAMEHYRNGALKGSNIANAKMACLYWRDTELKDIDRGEKYWERYFTSLDHQVITKDDFSNFNFYISLALENQQEIKYRDVLGVYRNQMLRLLNIRKEVCEEQHSGNIAFRDYMLNIINEEINFVRSLETIPNPIAPSDIALASDLLSIQNMGTIILVDVERGSFHVGDSIEIKAPSGISFSSRIKKIDRFGRFTDSVTEGENAGLFVEGSDEDMMFVKTGASIIKI